jgi:septation ring formation regulator EzrA
MSAKAPSDEAWSILLSQVAELQSKVATLENKATVATHHLRALEQEPRLDHSHLEPIREEIRDIVSYIARRDDIPELRVN